MKKICCICKKEMNEFGNNPYPVNKKGVCCNECNYKVVIPARINLANNLRVKESNK